MAPRRRKAKRRRSRTISVLNLAESYLYANVLTQGALGGSPYSVITGASDIAPIYGDGIYNNYSGTGLISLRDMVDNPNQSLLTVQKSLSQNVIPMVIQSAMIGVSFKLGKRLLRKPLNATNRGLKMALGAGIRL
tara:strand:- start:394 stop:798 length:405 start_codon:yes stop_codon:yes gene_type:complete